MSIRVLAFRIYWVRQMFKKPFSSSWIAVMLSNTIVEPGFSIINPNKAGLFEGKVN